MLRIYVERGDEEKMIHRLSGIFQGESYVIYSDLRKDFTNYHRLKDEIVSGDTFVAASPESLGLDAQAVLSELENLEEMNCPVVFLSYPTTYDRENHEVCIRLLKEVYERLCQNKTFDIREYEHPKTGRRKIDYPKDWDALYQAWTQKEITAKEFIRLSGLSKGTFYRLLNEYRKQQVYDKGTLPVLDERIG